MNTEHPLYRFDAGIDPPGGGLAANLGYRPGDNVEPLVSVKPHEFQDAGAFDDGNLGSMGKRVVDDPAALSFKNRKAVTEPGLQNPQPFEIGLT